MSHSFTKNPGRKDLSTADSDSKINWAEMEKLKSSFLSNVSHEIRTPLNAIVGFSNLLSDPSLKSDEREGFIRIINENCQSLLETMDKIFDMVDLEKNGTKLNEEEFSLPAFLDGIITQYSGLIPEENRDKIDLRLCIDYSYFPATIVSDPRMLKKILGHLIENSIKFTRNGFIEVGCTAREPGTLQFYVKDTGIGIPEEKLQYIFEKFSQVEEYYTRNYGGLGIGLTLAYGMVRKMGGEMFVESNLNQGSTFYFIIPLQEGEEWLNGSMADEIIEMTGMDPPVSGQENNPENLEPGNSRTYSFLPLTQRFSA